MDRHFHSEYPLLIKVFCEIALTQQAIVLLSLEINSRYQNTQSQRNVSIKQTLWAMNRNDLGVSIFSRYRLLHNYLNEWQWMDD